MISDQDRQIANEVFGFIERSEASGNSYEANLPIGCTCSGLGEYTCGGPACEPRTPDQRCLNCGARDGEECQPWCAFKPAGRPMSDVSMALAEHTASAIDKILGA